MSISADAAEARALEALGWLVSREDLLGVFMNATGTGAPDLRARAGDPEFLGAVLDFILMDDAWVVACCDATGCAYGDLALARAALPGGPGPHWT